jgi:ubiquinone/menaquinone biosynthesis C-methylase UbiE
MNTARAVRRIYEERPYPNLHDSAAAKPQWLLPPLPWINAVWLASHPLRRILVAGCGTGMETFALRRRFPDAEIVGVDFSPRSIRTAKKLQKKKRQLENIRFVVCDLSSSQFGKVAGNSFDFVSCHGVLSYIPRPERVLRNFARSLTAGWCALSRRKW